MEEIILEERRKEERLKDENEVTITVFSEENNLPKKKLIDNYTMNISVSGAGMKTYIRLPVDSLIEVELALKGVQQKIKTTAQVKWVKVIIEDWSYEAGVLFIETPDVAMQKLQDYISWKLEPGNSKFVKNRQRPIDSADVNNVEAKRSRPIVSDNANAALTKEQMSVKNKRWLIITMIFLGAVIVIAGLLKIFGVIPEFDSVLLRGENKEITTTIHHDAARTEAVKASVPPVTAPAVAPVSNTTTVPAPVPAPVKASVPVPEVKEKIKIIGNSDSKRYHLPGMKYYNSVKAHHRVEFDSEADAIKAGYEKAPQ